MELEIEFFGVLADIVGARKVRFHLQNNPSSLEEVETAITHSCPAINQYAYVFAINYEIVKDKQTTIWEKDKVALLPPYSGG